MCFSYAHEIGGGGVCTVCQFVWRRSIKMHDAVVFQVHEHCLIELIVLCAFE